MRGNFYYRRLGKKITEIRKNRQLSQEQLALLSNVDRSYLNEVETRDYENFKSKIRQFIERCINYEFISLPQLQVIAEQLLYDIFYHHGS